MKFFKSRNFLLIILFQLVSLCQALAQGNRDFMRETGKINVVVAVLLVIFLGIVWYLIRLERKLTNFERQIKDDHEWTH
ncbi:MAG: CcmD family protein [Lewinellaceae bacterium]|nr:CcmD family protein [Lewinellaceae bacterium]